MTEVAEVPPAVVTVTSMVPAPAAGEVAVIEVVELTVTPVAGVPPKLTVLAPTINPVPMIVTLVPPPAGPDVGEIDVTVGGGVGRLIVKVHGVVA